MAKKAPIYEGIKRSIRDRIRSGDLPVNARVPSEHELAKQLGISRNQTRLALRELELEGYITRRRGSGSFVAPAAGQIPSVNVPGSANTVAIVFPRLSRYTQKVVQGFMERAAAAEYQTIAYNLQADESSEAGFLRSVTESGVAGLVAWIEHNTPQTRGLLQGLRDRKCPVVLVDRAPEGLDIDAVVSDNEAIGYQLTNALIERGHTRIGFAGATSPGGASSILNRLQGYRRALGEAGIEADEALVLDHRELYRAPSAPVRELMSLRDRPTAFTCLHDLAARIMHCELAGLGYAFPEHVELATVQDEHPTSARHLPKSVSEEVTCRLKMAAPEFALIHKIGMAQRALAIGAQSAEVLLARIAAPDAPIQHRLIEPGPLVVDTGVADEPREELEEVSA